MLRLADMGQVKEGDILVTNSTDPGWTPVFTLLSAIVLETGGMLAHGSLLAREYGFPAVQIRVEAIGREELRERLEDAWLIQAPKRLAAAYVAERG